MKALFRLLAPPLTIVFFSLVVLDVRAEFSFVGTAAAWLLLIGGSGLALAVTAAAASGRGVVLALLVGALATLGIRTFGYAALEQRSPQEWAAVQDEDGTRIAERARARFIALCDEIRGAARVMASDAAVAVAVEGSDAQDYRAGAFDALARFSLPRAHPRGVSGATLYDALGRPIAWTGENVSLDDVLEDGRGIRSTLFIVEKGVHAYLVALEPLLSRRGFVSVEVPLSAERRLQNRYLEDYDAISSWLGRAADNEYLATAQDGWALSELFKTRGDPFRGGTEESPRYYFALRDGGGTLHGVSSVAGETPVIARLEARRRHKLAASVILTLTALFAAVAGFRTTPTLLPRLAALWGVRVVALATDLPLGVGLDLDDPASYASSLFFGLGKSPVDFLLTSSMLFITVLLIGRALTGPSATERSFRWVSAVAGSVATVALLVGANEVILDAWLNSSLALSTMAVFPIDPPRFTLQLGLVALFLAASSAATLILSRNVSEAPWVLAIDALVLTLAYLALGPLELGGHVLAAVPPFLVARVVSLRRERVVMRWSTSGFYARLATLGALLLFAVLSFYPAVAYFEDRTVRDFIETSVTPVVLQHRGSRLYAMSETAQAIDRMNAEGRLHLLAREDIAYQIWVATDLVDSSLSSSIEILDAAGSVVSRFALSFPFVAADAEKKPAPDEWILEEESFDDDPAHPGVLLARRAIEGPGDARWEIRVRVAADWRNLPFISTNNPYLYLFRTAGIDAPFRFPYRELDLFVFDPDGTHAFESTRASVNPGAQILDEARTAPVWWSYPRAGREHQAYLFSDGVHTFMLSYAKTSLLTYAAELAGWAILSAALTVAVLVLVLFLGVIGHERGVSPADLWSGVGTSFRGKLYVAFVLIALVPIALLSFFVSGVVIQQLQRDVEQDGVARAQVVERLVNEVQGFGSTTPISDAVLESVGRLAAVDVDFYSEGELVATSKPELFGSGLLRSRAAPSVFRAIALEHQTQAIHRESVGSFEYIVVSVPLARESFAEPGILALPLASQEPEIERRVSSMNQTLLVVALAFFLAAAALAYSLARRIADPINTLTEATHRVASGDLEVSLATTAQDEIGALFASFTQMTAELEQQRADLERTKKLEAWAEMARQVAHEVKNPLTPIQLSTEHLLRVVDDPKVDFRKVLEDCAETILQQVKSLRQISMEFSTFASPESLKPEPTDIEELVRETVEPYAAAPPDGVSVALDVAPDLPALEADQRLLKRTILNLVENALHALNGEGRVSVNVTGGRQNGSRFVEVAVSDTGVGIEPALKERIFEPYFSTRAAGTGLGLAIAKKVVEDHGGTIALESEPGRGTTVRMRLPAAENG